ncbi:MAG: hypothetical protein V4534_03510 [Myxococcota bacterium]
MTASAEEIKHLSKVNILCTGQEAVLKIAQEGNALIATFQRGRIRFQRVFSEQRNNAKMQSATVMSLGFHEDTRWLSFIGTIRTRQAKKFELAEWVDLMLDISPNGLITLNRLEISLSGFKETYADFGLNTKCVASYK